MNKLCPQTDTTTFAFASVSILVLLFRLMSLRRLEVYEVWVPVRVTFGGMEHLYHTIRTVIKQIAGYVFWGAVEHWRPL